MNNLPKANPFQPWSIEAQNQRLYDYLQAGVPVNFLQAREMDIGQLDSRIEDLRRHQVIVHERPARIHGVQCKEYSLVPFPDG